MRTIAIFHIDRGHPGLRDRLRDAGFRTTSASIRDLEPGDALERFMETEEPDVVIYDLSRPPEQHLELLQRVERLCREHEVPCILTAVDVSNLPDITFRNIACILDRPCDFELLRLAIGHALSDQWRQARDDRDDEAAA